MSRTRTLGCALFAVLLASPALAQDQALTSQTYYSKPVPAQTDPAATDPALQPIANQQYRPELQPMPGTAIQPVQGQAPQLVDDATLARAERQMNGLFDPISRNAGLPLGATQDAWSQPFDHMSAGQVAPGVVRFRWTPELIMPIRMREYMVTTIALPEWESVTEVFIGESTYFEASQIRDNAIALRVGATGIDTSVTVLGGSGNLYTFYARAETFNTRELTDVTVFVDAAPASDRAWFRSHGGAAVQAEKAIEVAQAAAADVSGTPALAGAPVVNAPSLTDGATIAGADYYIPREEIRFVHKMYEVNSGDREIAPEIVYTNGRWTFFHYGSKAASVDRPVVYRIVDGVETRVNTRTIGSHGEVLVAEAVGDFVLRGGQKVVCVKRFQGGH